jgi:hypothetical protein
MKTAESASEWKGAGPLLPSASALVPAAPGSASESERPCSV